jgi:hypothetical protein
MREGMANVLLDATRRSKRKKRRRRIGRRKGRQTGIGGGKSLLGSSVQDRDRGRAGGRTGPKAVELAGDDEHVVDADGEDEEGDNFPHNQSGVQADVRPEPKGGSEGGHDDDDAQDAEQETGADTVGTAA